MAEPAPEIPHEQQRFRISSRTYTDTTGPLVEVLLLLHDWSVERRRAAGKASIEPAAPANDEG